MKRQNAEDKNKQDRKMIESPIKIQMMEDQDEFEEIMDKVEQLSEQVEIIKGKMNQEQKGM